MLEIWNECLDKILKKNRLRNYNHLTVLQAFLAMGEFIEEYLGCPDMEPIIIFLQANIQLAAKHKKIDPILWNNWLQCIETVLSSKDSRYYLQLQQKN